MISRTIEIPDEIKSNLSEIAEYQGTNFSKLVALSGLSKTRDFIDVDLADIDFSNSDLRGFNFSGSDLSRSFGVNIRMDETTIFTNANVSGSVFSLEKEKRDFLAMNIEHHTLYNRLRDEYWTTGALWAGENLRRTSKNFDISAKIAKYLYASVKDQTYKNQILYGISSTFRTPDEYRDFLLNQLAEPSITHRSLRSVIDILGSKFRNDYIVRKILLLHIGHENREIRKICIRPVMTAKFFDANRDVIAATIEMESDPELRILYTKYFSEMAGGWASLLMFDDRKRGYLDYDIPIDNVIFERLVRGAVLKRKSAYATALAKFGRTIQYTSQVSFAEFVEQIDLFEPEFKRLKKMGLPLQLRYSAEHFRKQLRRSAVKTLE